MRTNSAKKRPWKYRYRRFTASLPSGAKPFTTRPRLLPKHGALAPTELLCMFSWQNFLATLRQEMHSTLSYAAFVIAAVSIIFLIVLADSSVVTSAITSSLGPVNMRPSEVIFRSWQTLSPLEEQLHRFHAVPVKYIRLLSIPNQQALLQLLSRPVSSSPRDAIERRAVFAHITACRLPQCLRALASALVYARTTGRVAVVFAEKGPHNVANVIRLGKGGLLKDDAVFAVVDINQRKVLLNTDKHLSDWAHFSVVNAKTQPHAMPNASDPNHKLQYQGWSSSKDPSVASTKHAESDEYYSAIGNTRTIATLDNLAAVDVHVSLSLSDVTWSDFVPRCSQEEVLANYLEPKNRFAKRALKGASILGRHKETKDAKNAENILYSQHHIPKLLLAGMTPLTQQLLLLKLMSKQRKGITEPKAIFVHAQYGLGNRLRALGSAMAFARRTGRVLVLIWVPDQHINCEYTDLFTPNDEFLLSSGLAAEEEWPFRNHTAKDRNMKEVKWYNFMRINGTAERDAHDLVIDDKHHHIYVSTCYVIQSPVTPLIIRTQSPYWHILRSLSPHIHVLRLIDKFASYPMGNMIGVHIRGKSIKADISGVSAEDYTKESSTRTDFWRNLTQVDTFIEEMSRQTPDQMFYVATDRKETLVRLDNEFPSRVFYTSRRCDSRERDCLPFALADILLLARCSSIRGSYWSSFTEISVRIGGAKFLLAGIDFGRPSQAFGL